MKALTLLIAALLAVALVGCGTKEETPATPAPAAPEPTSWWDGMFGAEPEPPVVVVEEPGFFDKLFGGEPEPAPEPVVEPSWFEKVFGSDTVAAK